MQTTLKLSSSTYLLHKHRHDRGKWCLVQDFHHLDDKTWCISFLKIEVLKWISIITFKKHSRHICLSILIQYTLELIDQITNSLMRVHGLFDSFQLSLCVVCGAKRAAPKRHIIPPGGVPYTHTHPHHTHTQTSPKNPISKKSQFWPILH